MDQLPLPSAEEEIGEQGRESYINQLMDYFSHNELDEPYIEPKQAFDDLLPYCIDAFDFDMTHMGGIGSFFMSSDEQLRILNAIIMEGSEASSAEADARNVSERMHSISQLSNDFMAEYSRDASMRVLSRLSKRELLRIYLTSYASMYGFFDVITYVMEKIEEHSEDVVLARLIACLCKYTRQHIDIMMSAANCLLHDGEA